MPAPRLVAMLQWLLQRLRSRAALLAYGLLGVYALCGFYAAPALLRSQLPALVQQHLGAHATVGGVRINPFLFSVELTDLALGPKAGEPAVIRAGRVLVDFETSSLLRWAWTFSRIELDRLTVNAELDARENLNLAQLFTLPRPVQPAPVPAATPASPPRLLLQHVAISGGAFSFTDHTLQPAATARFNPIDFELHDVSTLPDREGGYVLHARLPGGGNLAWQGDLTLAPIATDGRITLKDGKLATLWRFVRDEVAVAEPGGSFDISLNYKLGYTAGALDLQTDHMALSLRDVALAQSRDGAVLAQLKQLALDGGSLDLRRRRIAFTGARIGDGTINVALDETGQPDWARLWRPAAAPAKPTAPVPPKVKTKKPPQPAPAAPPAATPWQFNVPDVRIGPLALALHDHSRLQPLQVTLGRVESQFKLAAEFGGDPQVSVDALGLQVGEVRLRSGDAAEPQISVTQVGIENASLDLRRRDVHVGAVRISSGQTRITRDSSGQLDLASAFVPRQPTPPSDTPFAVAIDRAELDGYAVTYTDRGFQPALVWELEQLRVALASIALPAKNAGSLELAARAKAGGSLKAAGKFDLGQPGVDLKLDIVDLALSPLEVLVAQHTTLSMGTGKVSAGGRLAWNGKTGGVRYAGGLAVSDIDLKTAATGERLLAWQQLAATDIDLDTGANALRIAQLKLERPYARILISKDRAVNLASIMRPRPAPATPAPQAAAGATAEAPMAVSIERVSVERGAVDFADFSLILPFATNIKSLNGAVSGLSSAADSRAALKFEGRVEDYGLARAEGTIQPFAPKKFTDIAVIFRNVEMLPLSPYTATFAGRRIASGKLSLDLQYKVENSKLAGENKILLEQFVLGERVDSPDAVSLPLDLAIALLTDSEGKIDLAVPVSGNVDEPEFSYGHIVWQAIRTVIGRIVTAPFRALGALFGGGGGDAETLGDIVYDPGSARILPTEYDKVRRVAEGLQKRPQLKLLVQGQYHAERDGRALRANAVRAELAAREGVRLAPNEDPGPVGYDSAKAQRAMEVMLNEKAGADAAAQFAAAFQKETGREVNRVNAVLAVMGRGAGDRALYQALYRRLVDLRELPPTALADLARARAEGLDNALVKRFKLDPARVGNKPPEAATTLPDQGVPAKLTFEAIKP